MPSHSAISTFLVRAATIDERLSEAFEVMPASKRDCDASLRRLGAWCRNAASGNWHDFTRRLERDCQTLERILPALANIRLSQDAEPFDWSKDVEWLVRSLSSDYRAESATGCNMYPFEQIFYGLVHQATDHFSRNIASTVSCELPVAVSNPLRQELLRSLTALCEDLLYNYFDEYRTRQRHTVSTGKECIYRAYVAKMQSGHFAEILQQYPVLLRLIATTVRQWIESSAEFTRRLVSDLPMLRHELAPDAVLSRVSNLDLRASDLHNFGRSVCIITFESSRVVYKPRELSAEIGWNKLISMLNNSAPPFSLRTYRVVSLDGYGWCEYVHHCDTQTPEELSRFFRRAGALLSLCYILNGKDMHGDNVIAEGEHPVLIDLEMLFQPTITSAVRASAAWEAQNTANGRISKSVLRTGLLPTWLLTPNCDPTMIGGLHDRSTNRYLERVWRNINTDEMLPEWSDQRAPFANNLPRLRNEIISVADHAEEIVDGCNDYLTFLVGNKAILLSAIDAFNGARIRRLLRPTEFYHKIITRARDYRNMSDGAEWSAIVEFTSRFWSGAEHGARSWSLARQEREQLTYLNIPYFSQRTNDPPLLEEIAWIKDENNVTPIEEVRDTVRRIDAEEIDRQLHLLQVSLAVLSSRSRLRHGPDMRHGPDIRRQNVHDVPKTLSTYSGLSIAEEIASSLRREAILKCDSAAWIGVTPAAGDLGWQLSALGPDLYSGTPGISIFLAALAKLTGSTEWRSLALQALAPWRHILKSPGAAHFCRVSGVSGTKGVGSLIYAFCTCAEILLESDLRADAVAALSLVTDDLIESDQELDVVGGAASGILSFLKLYRLTNCAFSLDRALKCGHHLLLRRPDRATFRGMWHKEQQVPLTGFSHGAAGYAYALASLATASGESCFLDAAHDCLLYEQDAFTAERGNWKDLRDFDNYSAASYCCQWCHGATGIALARIGMLKFGPPLSDVRQELEVAIGTTQAAVHSEIDTLCCGNMGRVDALIEAAKFLGRNDLHLDAVRQARAVADRAAERGSFGWIVGNDRDNLGLFAGIAGVGFAMLRSEQPEKLPCILIWE